MDSDKLDDPLMTAQEVADYLGLAVGTVWNKVRAGHMPAYRLNRRTLRFRKSEIDEWVEAGCPPSAA